MIKRLEGLIGRVEGAHELPDRHFISWATDNALSLWNVDGDLLGCWISPFNELFYVCSSHENCLLVYDESGVHYLFSRRCP